MMKGFPVISCLTLAMSAALAVRGASAQESANPPARNPALTPEERAADLVHRMTLEEKASQLVNRARAIPRLGVPAYDWWSEALHGVIAKGVTEFPEPIGLAATFDAPGIYDMATAIGVEGRIKHAEAERAGHSNTFEGLDFWAPNVNIFRDPRWGRGQETYGEDPFLSARMAVAYVTGMQGDDPRYYRAIATPKHFDVHSGPEPTRHFADVDVSRHDLEDTYLPAFRAAIVEGHAGSVMCAYNAVKGEPACASEFLLQHTLRGAWQFQGYVVSDCGAVRDIFEGHHYRPTQPQASAIALERGVDNECIDMPGQPTNDRDFRPYIEAVQQGYLAESAIDTALIRLFTARIRLGMLDPPAQVPYAHIAARELDSAAHRELARRLAEESMVLLKNDGVLPLRSPRRIAIVGPLADQTRVLLGNYTGMPTHTVSVLEGMKAEFPHAEITFVPGTPFLANGDRSGRAPPVYPANTAPAPAAIAAARQAEVIVAVVGITSRLEGEEMPIDLPGFVGGDRTSLDLPRPEEELVEALAATHKPLVVVLMNGSALSVNWEKAHADAILEAWYAGEEGGTAVAETLSGKNDPAGRLPVTFYQGVHQLPHFEDYSMKGRTYRYFQGEPLWPFGYGLSYTSFRYGGLILPKAPLRAGDPLDVAVTVTNTGKRAGDEVVQLYLKFPDVPGAPLRALRGFERVHLAPGASRKVAFHLKPRDLSLVTAAGDILIAQGAYTLSIGGGQPGTEAPSVSGRFEIGGQLLLPE